MKPTETTPQPNSKVTAAVTENEPTKSEVIKCIEKCIAKTGTAFFPTFVGIFMDDCDIDYIADNFDLYASEDGEMIKVVNKGSKA